MNGGPEQKYQTQRSIDTKRNERMGLEAVVVFILLYIFNIQCTIFGQLLIGGIRRIYNNSTSDNMGLSISPWHSTPNSMNMNIIYLPSKYLLTAHGK